MTDKEILSVDFRDGSTLTERDLDLAFLQLLYICQEAYDALDGETAVAAKDRAEEILQKVTETYTQISALVSSAKTAAQEAASSASDASLTATSAAKSAEAAAA